MVVRGGARGGSFRGGARGRGAFPGYNRGGPGPGGRNSVFIPFQAFDIEHCENHFPNLDNAEEQATDSKLSELILQRNRNLVPDQAIISGKVKSPNKIFIQVRNVSKVPYLPLFDSRSKSFISESLILSCLFISCYKYSDLFRI